MFKSVESYYRFHSKIYNLTRWSILFGRNEILDLIPPDFDPDTILDLGCGTGKHLSLLIDKFPEANITGVDASESMTSKIDSELSKKPNIELINTDWSDFLKSKRHFDLVLCSYSLSLDKNPEKTIKQLKNSLSEDGFILITDFKSTPFSAFKKWMKFNHVDISGKIYNAVESEFSIHSSQTKSAWLGLWRYFLFCGRK